jgi:nucleotide-binding universal stress UspA family protein
VDDIPGSQLHGRPVSGPETGRSAVILAAIDGSPSSLRALAYAAGLTRRERAQLICAYVHQPSSAARMAAVLHPEGAAMVWDDPASFIEEVSTHVAIECGAWGTRASFVSRVGDPFAELTALAAELHADLIVTGAPTGVLSRVLPSLPSRVARRRRWPVMIVP